MFELRLDLAAPSAFGIKASARTSDGKAGALIREAGEAIAAGQLRRAIAVIDRLAAEDGRAGACRSGHGNPPPA